MSTHSKANLRKLIAQNKTRQAIDILFEMTKSSADRDLHQEVIMQSAKLEKLEADKRKGILSFEEQNLSKARINDALLQIVDKIPDSNSSSHASNAEHSTKKETTSVSHANKTKKKKYFSWSIIAGFMIIFGIIAGLTINYLPKKSDITTVKKPILKPEVDTKPQITETTHSPNTSTQPPTVTSKPKSIDKNTTTPKPTKVATIPKPKPLFDTSITTDIGMMYKSKNIADKYRIGNKISDYLEEQNTRSSTSFFLEEFKETTNYLKDLKQLNIEKHLNCILVIEEEIDFETKSRLGSSFFNAIGTYAFTIINIDNENINTYHIETTGAGTSETLSFESLAEHLFENPEFLKLKLELCKN